MTYEEPVYTDEPPFWTFPPEILDLLLEPGTPLKGTGDATALGTGIIPILGTARAGKTTLAYGMVDHVVRYTKRPVFFGDFPEAVIEKALPDHWKGRVNAQPIEVMWKADPWTSPVWVLDDSAIHLNARDSATSGSKALARLSGVLSHLGATLIFTTQSLAGVDLSLWRFTEVVSCIRYMNTAGLRGERDKWVRDVVHSQHLLRSTHYGHGIPSRRLRSFYVVLSDNNTQEPFRIVPYVRPGWLFNADPEMADMLSRPFKFLSMEEREAAIMRPSKGGAKRRSSRKSEPKTPHVKGESPE